MPGSITLEIEQAGCSSCASRIDTALSRIATVEEIVVDEVADTAKVRLGGSPGEAAVAAALADASAGSGHSYRIKSGSWQTAA
jgi:copper chaperone CopZ